MGANWELSRGSYLVSAFRGRIEVGNGYGLSIGTEREFSYKCLFIAA